MRDFGMHHHRGMGRGFGRGGFGGPDRHRGGERGERGMRGGRVFEQGDLRWVVLALIAETPRHGYEIIKDIEDRVGGAYSPSPGVIYPTLTFLEETGLVTVQEAQGARKLYAITPEGEAQLATNRASVDALFQRMSHVRDRSEGGVAPPVMRALENLRTAVRLKLQQGPLGDEQAKVLAEVLDAAAIAVERV